MADAAAPFDAPELPDGFFYRVLVTEQAIRVSIVEDTQVMTSSGLTRVSRVVEFFERRLDSFTYAQPVGHQTQGMTVPARPTARAMVSDVATSAGSRFVTARKREADRAELAAFSGDYRL